MRRRRLSLGAILTLDIRAPSERGPRVDAGEAGDDLATSVDVLRPGVAGVRRRVLDRERVAGARGDGGAVCVWAGAEFGGEGAPLARLAAAAFVGRAGLGRILERGDDGLD